MMDSEYMIAVSLIPARWCYCH